MAASDHLSGQQFYLRFGDWPENEQSFSGAGGYHEDGVSVYNMDHRGNPVNPDPDYSRDYADNDTEDEMLGRVRRAEKDVNNPSTRAHIVTGDLAGFGYDNEPLLQNVKRAGSWIGDRHKLIPGAPVHPIAAQGEW